MFWTSTISTSEKLTRIPCIFSSAADNLTSWSLVVVSKATKVIFRSLDKNDELAHFHIKLLAISV